ncbi:MAG: pyridoxamine 5'-phosphate oxidase family protein [Candidatus Parcubacteria bacterium]|nr:pyridoxamine 5'-phosphate oxidase family protein [Candidatus Parcubacteria bacterium]
MNNDELKKLVQEVLNDAHLISLGTVDENGVWVADVIYVPDEHFNLYWISMPQARHSQAIERNGKVACTVTASQQTNKERALQIEGVAEKIDGPLFDYEKKLEAKRGLPVPQAEGEILTKGHSWYVLKPTKVELIHSELFGYERKSVQLA